MKCPNCGNEVQLGEAYCGQCGTPLVPPVPSTNRTEMMSTPPPQSSRGTRPFPTHAHPISPQTGAFGPQQQGDFYQDATEAMPVLPNNPSQGYAPNYSGQANYPGQQDFPATPASPSYPTVPTAPPGNAPPTRYGGQSGQYSYHGQPGLQGPQTPSFQSQGQAHTVPQAPLRRSNNTGLVIVSVLLALALITIVGLGTLYFVRTRNGNPQPSGQDTAAVAATATASATNANAMSTANTNATSTATAGQGTPTPTATTAPSPTPTTVPTATPDAGFTYCGQPCLTNGYNTEYPTGWSQLTSGDGMSIQFFNPAQQDEFVTFRTPQTPANSATDVVANDLQTNYTSKQDFEVSSQTSTVVISGETWVQAIATYQGDSQKERVEVYGTLHAGKSYVIELQAPDVQFDQVNSQYFVNVTGRFQFQQ